MQNIIFYAVWILSGLVMVIFHSKRKYPVLSALFSMLAGIGFLLLANKFGGIVGFRPPINLFNSSVSMILGFPGVVMLFILSGIC